MKVLIFGASGNLGRNLTRKLIKNNYKIKAYTRNTHTSGNRLKVLGPIGYIEIAEGSIFDLNKIDHLTKEADVVVNLVGGDILLKSAQHSSTSGIELGQAGSLGGATELFHSSSA